MTPGELREVLDGEDGRLLLVHLFGADGPENILDALERRITELRFAVSEGLFTDSYTGRDEIGEVFRELGALVEMASQALERDREALRRERDPKPEKTNGATT